MFLQPKKNKYKKVHKKRLKKFNHKLKKTNVLNFGNMGLKALESGLISSKQLESSKQAINKTLKKSGKIRINVFPNLPITKKPTETRMGKGVGSIDHWTVKITGRTILLEIFGASNKTSLKALKTGKTKLPIKTKIIFNL